MRESVRLVVENCEQNFSDWLFLEYRHCTQLWKNLVFTNIKSNLMRERLSQFGKVREESILDMKHKERIVLDPFADKTLRTDDFEGIDEIVIGGILGHDKFTGRTKILISDKLKAGTRNLGKRHLPIDIAAFVTKLIYLGMRVKDIEFTDELEISFDSQYSITLPYGYPVIEGKIIVTPGLIEYLNKTK